MRLLIAIPCLDEAATIGALLKALPRSFGRIHAVQPLVIDDGSSDETAELARIGGAEVIRHRKTRGLGVAFRSAVDYALAKDFDVMVTLDGDGQFDATDIPRLVDHLLATDSDMVTASRFSGQRRPIGIPSAKYYGNQLISAIISTLTGQRLSDVSCGFRCYAREALLMLNLQGRFTYTQESLLDLAAQGAKIEEIAVEVHYFSERRSRVAHSVLAYGFKAGLIILRAYRDHFPLRFFWGMSAFSLVISLSFGSIFFWHFFQTGRFTGFLFAGFTAGFFGLISLIFFIGGLFADMFDRLRENQQRSLKALRTQDPLQHCIKQRSER
jgi:glycosyltransferase involved in cell wall biosynthesis